MVKRPQTKKDRAKELLKSTYLTRMSVTPLDLGIIQQPKLFSNSKQERSYKRGVKHAKEDLKLLNFFLINLRPKYRTQIINSTEFQNVIQQVLDIGVGNFYDMSKEEKENANVFAIQLLSYSLKVMIQTMPPEFLKPIKDNTIPLNNLLKSIYNFSKNNNLKELPSFRELDFFITETD